MNKRGLLKLAEHLELMSGYSQENFIDVWIEWPDENFSIWYAVKYNSGFYKDLPNWFTGWINNEMFDEPELKGELNLGFARSCMKYFCLSPKEFSHLFDIDGHQNVKLYGGEILSKSSSPFVIASNIKEFVKLRV